MTKLNINDLTLGEIRELINLFGKSNQDTPTLNGFIGKKVIIRTYSAGVFYGEIIEKVSNEIILKNARRLYYWKTVNNGISLSEVAEHGLHNDSKVCAATKLHWLQAIEIILCSEIAIKSIEEKNEYRA